LRRFRIPARRLVPAVLLLLVAAFAVACNDPQTTINPKSDHALAVQHIYEIVFWAGAAVFVAVMSAAVIFSIAFRERPGRQARQIHGNTRLEVLWTFIPVVILVAIAVPTFKAIVDINSTAPADQALNVVATGHQWWFEFNYPDQGFETANELHLVVNKPVDIKILSADVIHSLWMPQLSGKVDMVPGHENHMSFTPNTVGEYRGQCAEFCGPSHANMRFRVFVQTQQDFDAWAANQKQPAVQPTSDLAKAGEQVFTTGACIGCHTINGTVAQAKVGPDLTHVGSRTTIAGGTLDNTAENVAKWLHDPPAVKPGSIMPNLHLTDDQIQKLVAYLESLK
jgi:cytochrome c oxidase subunit II